MTISATSPSSSVDRINLAVATRIGLLLTAGLPAFAAAGLTPILPAIATHFADYPNIGVLTRLMVSIIGVALIVGSPPIGALADRYGRRGILLAGLMLYALAGCAGFVFDNPYVILVTRILLGFATAAVGTMVLAIVASQSHGQARNRWLGYINTAGTASALILIPLSGLVGKSGWHRPFLLHSIALPLFGLVCVGLPQDQPAAFARTSTPTQTFNIGDLPWSLLIFAIACGVVVMTPGLYVPFHLSDMGVGDPRNISLAMVMMTGGTVISSLLYGSIRARLSLNATFVVGFSVSATGLIAVAIAWSYGGVLVGQAVGGFGCALVAISLYALAAQTGREHHRSRTMGIAKGGLYAGPIVGQAALEPIMIHTTSSGPLFAIAGVAVILCVIYAFRVVTRVPQGTT
jgi:MFS family permease